MRVKRFFAADMRSAMKLVRDEMGADASIIANRRVAGGIELTAALDYEAPRLTPPTPGLDTELKKTQERILSARASLQAGETPAAGPSVNRQLFGDSMRQAAERGSPVARELLDRLNNERAAPAAEAPAAAAASAAAAPAADSLDVMRAEIAGLRDLLESQLGSLAWGKVNQQQPRQASLWRRLVHLGLPADLCRSLLSKVEDVTDIRQAWRLLLAHLAQSIPVMRSEPIDQGGVIALVGPTGAGKTTTAAKLAARFAARHRARDVALVTTDCQRPGAREQLQAHGRRLGITVCEAEGPERLQDALAQLVDYPLVLVDTTGHAPRDRAVFSQILWLRASRRVRSLLVLPANAHPHDLGEVIRRYRPAKPEGVVLTKLDESGRPGAAFSVLAGHGLGLAYTSRGQDVPADIDAADATALVQSLEKSRRAADNPLATEDHHAVA